VILFPAPLSRGDCIGVTSPSAGVPSALQPRLEFCVEHLRAKGYEVVVGRCMNGDRHVSASAVERAAELTEMLVDPAIRAVIPPWGGELAVNVLPLLGWSEIRAAEPTWFIGYSDISTLLTPLTLLTGIATLHGNNLMDTPYVVPRPLLSWLDIVRLPPRTAFTQGAAVTYRSGSHDQWEVDPTVTTYQLDRAGDWRRLDGQGDVTVSGRLIGGCVDTLNSLTGTAFGAVSHFADRYAPEGLILYLEVASASAYDVARYLHGMRLSGWMDAANAIIIGRSAAAGSRHLTQTEAALDALSGLEVPIIGDFDCGHLPPHLPIVNGAMGTLVCTTSTKQLTQILA
jgi:muramoyltetrapeptide carboxypeptidase